MEKDPEREAFERRKKSRIESIEKPVMARDGDGNASVKYGSPDSLPIIKAVVKAFGMDEVGSQKLTENQNLQLHKKVKIAEGDYEYMSPVDLYDQYPDLVERYLDYLASWWDKPGQDGSKKPKKTSSKIVQFLTGYGYKIGILSWAIREGRHFPDPIGGKSREVEQERNPQYTKDTMTFDEMIRSAMINPDKYDD